jgi:hypothetical protein
LNADAVTIRDEVVLPLLHPHHLGLVAGSIAAKAFDVHRELTARDRLRQQVPDVADPVVQLQPLPGMNLVEPTS